MPDILVRNIEEVIAERIKAIAREREWSINDVIVHLLRQGLGRGRRRYLSPRNDDIAVIGGTWDSRETKAFRSAVGGVRANRGPAAVRVGPEPDAIERKPDDQAKVSRRSRSRRARADRVLRSHWKHPARDGRASARARATRTASLRQKSGSIPRARCCAPSSERARSPAARISAALWTPPPHTSTRARAALARWHRRRAHGKLEQASPAHRPARCRGGIQVLLQPAQMKYLAPGALWRRRLESTDQPACRASSAGSARPDAANLPSASNPTPRWRCAHASSRQLAGPVSKPRIGSAGFPATP